MPWDGASGRPSNRGTPNLRVAVMASGGLSHFVVDEEIDRATLKALAEKDVDGLRSLPREKLRSGTSEILNWVALGERWSPWR